MQHRQRKCVQVWSLVRSVERIFRVNSASDPFVVEVRGESTKF